MANHYTPENILEPDGYHLPSSQVLSIKILNWKALS